MCYEMFAEEDGGGRMGGGQKRVRLGEEGRDGVGLKRPRSRGQLAITIFGFGAEGELGLCGQPRFLFQLGGREVLKVPHVSGFSVESESGAKLPGDCLVRSDKRHDLHI